MTDKTDLKNIDLSTLSRAEKEDLLRTIETLSDRTHYNKLSTVFPEKGPLRRELYDKFMKFYEAGSNHKERALVAANRVGKTFSGGVEVAYHATGLYPSWWKGRKFDKPVKIWVISDSNTSTRDILQELLIGNIMDIGSGLLPKDTIVSMNTKPGVPDAKQDVYVQHSSGGYSQITFKSYEAGRTAFQGTAIDVIWADEEPPSDVYSECLTRTMTTKGIVICTFTPLSGMTDVVMSFLDNGKFPKNNVVPGSNKWAINVDWDDVPHLSNEDKKILLASYAPHEREARSKGFPSVGSGKIYQVPEEEFVISPFDINPKWKRAYGLDVGWRVTAAVFGAYDEENDILYIYDEYRAENESPGYHAHNLRRKSQRWIPGAIDPSAAGAGKQKDGFALLDAYREEDLDLYPANNSVDIGIHAVYDRLTTGRLKISNNCQHFLNEYRLYRRDNKGNIVKANDHVMDATRYLVMTGLEIAIEKPDLEGDLFGNTAVATFMSDQSRNPTTGY